MRFRFAVPFFLPCAVQVGLYLSLREVFLPRREQVRARIWLAASQIAAAVCARLVLSGHTHGGQFALSRSWSLARFRGPRTMGVYRYRGESPYVRRGMSIVAPVAMQLGSPPEIAFFTLRAI